MTRRSEPLLVAVSVVAASAQSAWKVCSTYCPVQVHLPDETLLVIPPLKAFLQCSLLALRRRF